MVDNLEALDFKITDNGVAQQVSHFDLGGDPISMVILIETSSRIEPLLPQIRKTGILFTQTVMGPTGEAAVVGFNRSEEHTSELQSQSNLVCRLLLEKKKTTYTHVSMTPQFSTHTPSTIPVAHPRHLLTPPYLDLPTAVIYFHTTDVIAPMTRQHITA